MVHVTRRAFDRMVEEAIASLPKEYARWLDEVPVIVEDRPSRADLRASAQEVGDEEEPMGTFGGRVLGAEEYESGELPPSIMIYRVPLMEACTDVDQLAQEIRKT